MIHAGDCLDVMAGMESDSVDSIVTDPPYGLRFMGKAWDHGIPGVPFWTAARRVAKPGAYLLAFGGTRTWHRLACAIEDAGWDIRDTLCWMYGSGFPKGKRCLKPAWEPIIMARKVGPGDLQIDACRIPTTDHMSFSTAAPFTENERQGRAWNPTSTLGIEREQSPRGRWPANVILDEQAAAMLDAEVGDLWVSTGGRIGQLGMHGFRGQEKPSRSGDPGFGDSGGPSRFFYCAKASRAEREAGLEGMPRKAASERHGLTGLPDLRMDHEQNRNPAANNHPTIKPLDLMRWLCRLVTPPGGTVLDCFAGSGTTGCAAAMEGLSFIGCEKEAEYVRIAEARIAHWSAQGRLPMEAQA